MAENQVALESKGIKRALKKFSVYDAIAEYIWNGFDANATKVDVSFQSNKLKGISQVSITDNGVGISRETLLSKFTPIFASNKLHSNRVDPRNSSMTHGKNGIGRFTFFTFAEQAKWSTVYADGDRHYQYSIEIHQDSLDKYRDSDVTETDDGIGTTVTFYNFSNKEFELRELREYLVLEFAWYLELNKNHKFNIRIDGQLLDYSSVLAHSETKEYVYEEEYKDKKTTTSFNVTFAVGT